MGLIPTLGFAQSDSYDLDIYPDLWYNSVDGVRVGGFVLGQMDGEFQSGPHRLDAGVWLGTYLPDLPVSYYISFTEPINKPALPGNEANFRIESSIRTGYSQHGVSFNKRWQLGFDDIDFQELSISINRERMFDFEYRPYPQLWEDDWKSLAGAKFWLSRNFELGRLNLKTSVTHNLASETFTKADLEITQQIQLPKGFKISLRGFSGYVTEDAAPEYFYGISYRPAAEWLDKGISRAKGTVPQNLLEQGVVHFSGGANLRGFLSDDFEDLNMGYPPAIFNFVNAINIQFDFPNPINPLFQNTLVGDFIQFDSYLFGDLGNFFRKNYVHSMGLTSDLETQLANAGIGFQFSINIPDYLGKDRGFALRYEIPFWLSDKSTNENNFKFRNLIGIGAVISL